MNILSKQNCSLLAIVLFFNVVYSQLPPGHIIVGQTVGLWTVNLASSQSGGGGFDKRYDVDHQPGNGNELSHNSYTFEDHGQYYYVEYLYGHYSQSYNLVEIAGNGGYPVCFNPGDTIGPWITNWDIQLNIADPYGETDCRYYFDPEYYALRWVRSVSPPYDTIYGYKFNDQLFFGMPDTMPVGIPSDLKEQGLSVFPNPANSQVKVKFAGELAAPSRLQLLNMEGKVMLDFDGILEENLTMDVSTLPSGIYQVVHIQGERRTAKRLVVQRE